MITFPIKILISIIILLVALAGGILPIIVKKKDTTKNWLSYGESFAGGIFLGAGLIHLLPDAQNVFVQTFHIRYPYSFAICAFSILLLRIIEEGVGKILNQSYISQQTWLAYLLTILLSVHSVLAGAALGIETTIAAFIIIFVAIIAHKGSAAFALGVSMQKSTLNKMAMIRLLLLFSVMTPIGILFGSFLTECLKAAPGQLAEAIFNAIAAGTFIYIAAFHSINNTCTCGKHEKISATALRLISFALGLILMALIAIYL